MQRFKFFLQVPAHLFKDLQEFVERKINNYNYGITINIAKKNRQDFYRTLDSESLNTRGDFLTDKNHRTEPLRHEVAQRASNFDRFPI